jgi:hypothetical protein
MSASLEPGRETGMKSVTFAYAEAPLRPEASKKFP